MKKLITILFLIATFAQAQDHVLIRYPSDKQANFKQGGKPLFKKYYGEKFLEKVGKCVKPENWSEMTKEEQDAWTETWFANNDSWSDWAESGWNDYVTIGNTNEEWRVGCYWRKHLERGGYPVTQDALKAIEQSLKQISNKAEAVLTNDVGKALSDWNIEPKNQDIEP